MAGARFGGNGIQFVATTAIPTLTAAGAKLDTGAIVPYMQSGPEFTGALPASGDGGLIAPTVNLGERLRSFFLNLREPMSANLTDAGRSGLTIREREILSMICDGMSYKEIAKALNLSPHTVNNHRNNIMEKLECTKVTQVVAKAFQLRLVERT